MFLLKNLKQVLTKFYLVIMKLSIVMTRSYFIALNILLAVAVISCTRKQAAESEPEPMASVFNSYAEALKSNNGAEAMTYTSEVSKRFYDSLITDAIYADSAAINNKNIIYKIAMLNIRHSYPLAMLDTLTGEKFMLWMWNQGINDFPETETIEVKNCATNANAAACNVYINNNAEPEPYLWKFNNENGGWKVDVTSILDQGTEEVSKSIAEKNQTEDEFLLNVFRKTLGDTLTLATLYKPLK